MNPTEDQFFKDLDRRLWTAADKLRSNLDAAVYKHAVLGLIFLKYISDTFEERRTELQAQFRDPEHDYYLGDESMIAEELEVRDYYTERNVFWVPALARWNTIQSSAKLAPGTEITVKNGKAETYRITSVGRLLDDALEAVERDNTRLRRVLSKDFARLEIDSGKLGQLIDLIATVPFHHESMKARDILGHVYEYFLGQFATAEGKKGGQYYTPKAIVTLIVEMIEPFQGRVFDPCCGSGGFFIQSERFIEAHADRKRYKAEEQRHKIAVYGQESNPTTWRLAAMNLAINAIDFDLGKEWKDSFLSDLHPDLRADFIMANPPFNMKEWGAGQLQEDVRWKYGIPPANNANFAWMQHMIHHLAPHGSMGLLLANGSMSSNTNNEGEIRKAIIKADLVECIVALPGQLFTNTQIPACIWFLTRNKAARNGWRDRKGETLFVNARSFGYMKDRVTRDFTMEDVERIAGTFHAWKQGQEYEDVRGFCKSANLAAIEKEDFVLTPGRYVGPEDRIEDTEPFGEKMTRLTKTLVEQFAESTRLETEIRKNLATLGFLPKE